MIHPGREQAANPATPPTRWCGPAAAAPLPVPSTPSPAPAPAVRERTPTIAGFQVLRRLGHGGMGIVYLAREIALNRLVALKVVAGGAFADGDVLDRFQREAESIACLQHPHIVQIFSVGSSNGGDESAPPSPYIALEYVANGTLAAHTGKPVSPRSAARLVATLAKAVHYAHERGIVHRDLKPGNVLMQVNPKATPGREPLDMLEPKVTDFGLAKRAEGDSCTIAGTMLGTPEYMSPEQASGRTDIGPASDVYSLGVMLYELLTGFVPFRGTDSLDTLQSIRSQEPVAPSRLQARLHRDLDTICLRCLEKEPSRRYRSAAALVEDLHAWLDGRPITARPVGALERTWKWTRRHPTTAGLMAAVLAVTLIGMSGVVWQWRRAEDRAASERRALESTRDLVYFNNVNLAHREIAAGRRADAARLLAACLPSPGEPDRRSWEWNYLNNLCRQELFSFQASQQWIWDVDFSPDGRHIVTAAGSPYEGEATPGELTLWDVATGKPVREFVGHTGSLRRSRFNRAGDRVCSTAWDGTARVWNVATGKAVGRPALDCLRYSHPIVGLFGVAGPADFAADDRRMEYQTSNGWMCLDPDTGKREPCRDMGQVLGQSIDRRYLVRYAGDANFEVVDRVTGQSFGRHRFRKDIFLGAVTPDGKRVVLVSYSHAELRDSRTGELLLLLHTSMSHVQAVAIDPTGRRVATAAGLQVQVQDFDAHRAKIYTGHNADVRCLAFSPDGERLVSADRSGRVCLWDASREPLQDVLVGDAHSSAQFAVALDSQGENAFSVTMFQELQRHNLATHERVKIKLPGITRQALFPRNDVQFTADARFVFAPLEEDRQIIRQWNTTDGHIVREFKGHTRRVTGLAVSGDGRRLASRTGRNSPKDPNPGEILFWDAVEGRLLRPIASEDVIGLALSHDGLRLAAASLTGELIVWNTDTGQELWRAPAHVDDVGPKDPAFVFGLAFSPDGRWIGSAGFSDGLVRVWNAQTGQAVGLSLPGGASLTGVTFTPDSRRILAAGYDSEIRMWDVASGQLALILRPPVVARQGDIAYTARPVFSQHNGRLLLLDHVAHMNCWDGHASK